MKKTKLKIIVKMRKIYNFKYNYDVDYNIPAYHSGFSGIITEKHIKLRYYGEG